MSQAGDSTFNKFDAKAKSDVFGKVFDVGLPMWEKLAEKVTPEMPPSPSKILSVGDGPGEPVGQAGQYPPLRAALLRACAEQPDQGAAPGYCHWDRRQRAGWVDAPPLATAPKQMTRW